MSGALAAQITSPETGAEAPATAAATEGTTAPASTERPDWLPAKFKDVEQMAAAYAELEKKQGGAETTETPAEGAPATSEEKPVETAPAAEVADALKTAGLNVESFTAEIAKDGKLSDESYKALADKGYPKSVVDVYVQGLQAQASAYENTVYEAVGGADSYKELSAWAVKNVPAAELKAFNEIVEGGDAAKAAMAAAGLKSKMEAAFGRDPALIGGNSKVTSDVYGSWQEMQSDIRDPRYKIDPAFVKKVQDKALRSTLS